MSGTVYGLLLQAKGEIKRVKVSDGKAPLTRDSLQTILKKKTAAKELGQYPCSSNTLTLTLFGYDTGKVGTENKHELPPPHNDEAIYGDILLVACKADSTWHHPVSFTTEQYEKFYALSFGDGEDDEEDDDDDEDDHEHEEEKEEDAELDVGPASKKKKAAEEDGEPEDEGDDEHEEEEVEDDEEGHEEEGEADGEEGYDDEPKPKARAAAKKKASKPNTTVIQNTGRAKQQSLLLRPGFQELTIAGPLPKETTTKEYEYRTHMTQTIQKQLGTVLTAKDQVKLERSILMSAMQDADTKHVIKHFDNGLFQVCYMAAARRILSNLQPNNYVGNNTLLKSIQDGTTKIEDLGSMTVQDFAPHMYKGLHERMLLREKQQLEGNKAFATDQFECHRCHKRECTFYEMQTRSADEPMTKFINCLNCGNHWRK